MELLILGSGAFNSLRNPSGYAILRGRETMLFDLGFGNLRQLARAGVAPSSVSHLFLTHFHPDHGGDVAALLFSFRYDDRPRSGFLRLFGPPGLKDWMRKLTALHGRHVRPRGYKLEIREIVPGKPFKGDGWKIVSRRTKHPVFCNAYRFSADDKDFVYTGDTAWDPGLAAFARGADLFLLESTMPAKKGIPGVHLGVDQSWRIAQDAGAKRTVFTHLTEISARQLRRKIKGRRNFRVAADTMRLKI